MFRKITEKMWFQLSVFLILSFLQLVCCDKILENNNFEMEAKIMDLIITTAKQDKFQTILLKYDESLDSCGELDFYMKYFQYTIIIENLQKSWELKNNLNTHVLCVVCLKRLTVDYQIEMDSYFDSLHRMRDTKMIFYINHNRSANYLAKLEDFFKYCWNKKSLNVLAIFKDFYLTNVFYTYTPFPKFEMIARVKNGSKDKIFPNRLKDLKGFPLLTLPDQVEPRTYLTKNKRGEIKVAGYVGHFIHLLVERLNATLKFPFPIKKGDMLFYGYLETLARNYTIDFAGTVIPITNGQNMMYYSYPFQITNICLMIPLANIVPFKELFFHLMGAKTFIAGFLSLYLFTLVLNLKKLTLYWRQNTKKDKRLLTFSDYILNDVALRGILGQPFKMWINAGFVTKFIYILLSVTGLYLSLINDAFLQTLLTRPLKVKEMKTFEDLQENKFFVLLSETEVLHFRNINTITNHDIIFQITTYENFNFLRSHLNTSYAYPTSSMQWNTLFNQQQELLKEKIFIYSEDACILHTNFLSFPLAQNSIYREPIHDLIMLVRDHGLFHHWFQSNFVDLVASGQSTLFDFSVEFHDVEPLNVYDLELVFGMYIGLTSLAILVFFAEISYYRYKLKNGQLN
ncbi:uncharacterized protein ACRADG_010527 [Cochliomyia hominivorax]